MGSKNRQQNVQPAYQAAAPAPAPAAAPEGETGPIGEGGGPTMPQGPVGIAAPEGVPPNGDPLGGFQAPEGSNPDTSTPPEDPERPAVVDPTQPPADVTTSTSLTSGATGAVVSSASDKVGAAVAPAAVAAVAAQKAAVTKTGIYSPELQALLDHLSTNKIAQAAFAELHNYLVEMKPGKMMDWEQGARYQVSLYRTLQLIINQTTDDFPRVFGTLLAVYHEFGIGRGALGPQHLFRFTGMINMTADDIKGFHSLNHLLVMLADPSERAANIKHIDFNVQLQHGLTEDGRRRILAYFNR